VIIHIHLRHPIMVDKKKTHDVQLYREVIDAVDETGSRRRNTAMDRDEIESEEHERKLRKMHNKDFKGFAKEIADKSDGLVELDEPFRDLGFYGVPFRANVLMQPTIFCLVHLTESPYFVVTIEDVELVYLERVEHGLKSFDMVFVFKDYKKTPVHINTIQTKELESIKEWLE
jgi:nucleosome binding factor SPN SPT16 subunit